MLYLPQLGNRRYCFLRANNPFVIRAAGTFLSWAQAKASSNKVHYLQELKMEMLKLGIKSFINFT